MIWKYDMEIYIYIWKLYWLMIKCGYFKYPGLLKKQLLQTHENRCGEKSHQIHDHFLSVCFFRKTPLWSIYTNKKSTVNP